MLKITNKAVGLFKDTKSTKGLPDKAGIRIQQRVVTRDYITIDFDFRDGPEAGDAELEQDGLRIFVEDALKDPLARRTLDVRDGNAGLALVFV